MSDRVSAPVLYDHKGQAVASGAPARSWVSTAFFLGALMLMCMAFYQVGRVSARAASVTPMNEYRDSPAAPVASLKFQSALSYAVREWSHALGAKIDRPGLFQGRSTLCGPSGGAIACADHLNYRIILMRTQIEAAYDWRSIMMHELGHLLGVPHIEGDPLMESEYTEKVIHPTRFAVAIAKEARKGED